MLPVSALVPKGRSPRRRPPFFRTPRIAIIGCTTSKAYAPYHDARWTLVAHPAVRKDLPVEPDWWMDMHGPQNFRAGKDWCPNYYQWLKSLQVPIFMQEDWPDVPQAVRFPKERILSEARPYFTNHVAWMIALAMTEGATHIGLWGCEYKHDFERGQQRGSAEYWLGRFEGAGGHVVLPPDCSLLHDPPDLYGYDSHDEAGKLKPSYMPAHRRPKAKTAPAEPSPPALTIVPPGVTDGVPPLIGLPDGEAPAIERAPTVLYA